MSDNINQLVSLIDSFNDYRRTHERGFIVFKGFKAKQKSKDTVSALIEEIQQVLRGNICIKENEIIFFGQRILYNNECFSLKVGEFEEFELIRSFDIDEIIEEKSESFYTVFESWIYGKGKWFFIGFEKISVTKGYLHFYYSDEESIMNSIKSVKEGEYDKEYAFLQTLYSISKISEDIKESECKSKEGLIKIIEPRLNDDLSVTTYDYIQFIKSGYTKCII